MAAIDGIENELLFYHREAEALFNSLNELTEFALKTDVGGNSDFARKSESIKHAMEYEMPNGEIVDLTVLRRNARERFKAFDSIMKSVERKQHRLVLSASLLKTETAMR